MTDKKPTFLEEYAKDRNYKVFVEIVKYDGNEGPWPVKAQGSEYMDKEKAEMIFESCRRMVQ